MKTAMFLTSALRRVCPQGLLLAGLIGVSATGLQASSGTHNGFYWQNYVSSGTSTMTFGSGGNYNVSYSNVGDVVAGEGWNPGSASRTVNYNCGSLTGSFNNFGVYGWTTNPLIEYYITERGSVGGTFVGTVSSNGGTYNVYKQQRVNQPSIQGTATFWQYKNSRQSAQSLGANHSVTVANHVNYWKAHIGSMGAFNLQIVAVEAFGGKSGSCNCTVW